jgi:hypothetical protein
MLNPCSGSGAICTWANNASISVGGVGTYFGYFATGRHRIGRPSFDGEYPGLPEAGRNLKGPIRAAGWAGIAVSAGTDYLGYRAQGDSRGKSLGKAVVATGVSTAAGTIGTYAGTWAGETMGAYAGAVLGALIPGLGETGISEVVLGAVGATFGATAGGYVGNKIGNWVANNLFGW